MRYFIAVNYGTSDLIESWVSSIRKASQNFSIVLVDNFKNQGERDVVRVLREKLGFNLIELENVGYGQALNKAIDFCLADAQAHDFIVFAGNLDIAYESLPDDLPEGRFVYVAQAMEGERNRNPFLTKMQRRVVGFHRLSLLTNSLFVWMAVILVTKIVGKIPSKIWTVHGSLFIFSSKCIDKNREMFNAQSFLYSEELEFGSYMESKGAKFIDVDIVYRHAAHAATGSVVASRREFMSLWVPSFRNWVKRWA